MIGRPPNACVKCGHGVPQGAGFCPNCGTAVHDIRFNVTSDGTPETLLPSSMTGPASTEASKSSKTTTDDRPTASAEKVREREAPTIAAESAVDNAPTVGPSNVVTSLSNPSRPPGVRAGDGPFQPGQQVGPRYTILKLLGTGGMGAVYQAFDHELGVAVAIKVIRPAAQSDASAAKDLEQRFKRELVLARQVTHKHVVRIHDLGEIDGIKYLTMPFIEGETLSAVMRRAGTLPLARVIKIAQQIAQGLAAAHDKGVIHRDLKPENIMIERQVDEPIATAGDALIMDFGIARSMEAGDTQTAAGSVIGTLEYMAPEQAQGVKCDQRCDQYSFGLIIYDMLLGRHRTASTDNAMAGLLARIAAPPASPRSVNPDIPEPLDQIVMRCLQPNPDARFANTLALVDALDHLTPDGHLRSDVHEIITVKARPAWQLAAAAAVIVTLAGTAGWIISNRTSSDTATVAEVREPVSVLIADFQNLTNDPLFEGSLEQALAISLEGASFITTFPRRDAMTTARAVSARTGDRLDENTARLVSQREGIKVVLAGTVARDGSGYKIDVRAIDAVPGTVLATATNTVASKPEVLQSVADVASEIREELGEVTPESERLAQAETLTASSLDAVKSYSVATELASAGRDEEAIDHYRKAIEHDPKFGRAYSGWAISAFTAGRRQEADEKWKEALALLDRMTEREKFRTLGSYYLRSGSYESAIENYTDLVNRYPADRAGHSNLALAYFYSLHFPKSLEHGRKAIEIYPQIARFRNNQALYAMYAGEFATAETEARGVLERDPGFYRARLPIAVSAIVAAEYDRARHEYAEMQKGDNRAKLQALLGLADLAMYLGQPGEAVRILESGITPDERAKKTDAFGRKAAALAEAYYGAGKTREGLQAGREAIDATMRQTSALPAVRALIGMGAVREATAVAASWQAQLQSHPRAYAKIVEAEIALSEKRIPDAIGALRAANDIADLWLRRFLLGVAYVEAGAYAEAISELEQCQKRRGEATALLLDDVPTVRYLATLPYWLGRAQEGLNMRQAAADNYGKFLAARSSAERDPLVADASRRLASATR